MAVIRVKCLPSEYCMVITSPVGNVVKCSLCRHNILPLFNLSWLQNSVAAMLLFLKQPRNKI